MTDRINSVGGSSWWPELTAPSGDLAFFDVEQVEQDQQAKQVEPQVAHELTRASGERANSQAAEAFYA
ncbi:hypothetical protein OFN48_33020, partial [Escherichia coli]|nr:hypothetical protein [Escherichia coli]